MKHVIITRGWSDSRATLGLLKVVECSHDPIFTLENPLRDTTVDSRIPAGIYEAVKYSSDKHPRAWLLKDVPGRDHILIHSGNTEKDTLGCILVGLSCGTLNNEPRLNQSRDAISKLDDLLGSEDILVTVLDDRSFC